MQGSPNRRAPRYPSWYGRRRLTQATGTPGIIGLDGRVQVNNTFPHTTVVRLVYSSAGVQLSQCTAFFIANKAMLTTASCMFNLATKSFYDRSLITMFDSQQLTVNATIEAVVIPVEYTLGMDNFDVAVLILKSATNFQDTYGYLGRGLACDIKSGQAVLLGYPRKCRV
jgi:V8-like Glu-specific endopeptidase